MNTLQSLIDNGIELYTAQSMIDNYSSKINTMNGIYIITDITYDFDTKGRDVTLKCTECGREIHRMMINGRNKWGELIKTCPCQKEKKMKEQEAISEKIFQEKKAVILSRIGNTYGDYKIISAEQIDGKHMYTMQCTTCGAEKNISAEENSFNNRVNFHCTKHYEQLIKYDESYMNKKNNFLTVIGLGRNNGKRCFICKCECGNIKNVEPIFWERGIVKSCGCMHDELNRISSTKHGHSGDRLYIVYRGMVERCNNKNNPNYHNYGGRGIKICDGWTGEHGFENFYDWAMQNGYDYDADFGQCTIDRIDVDGDYRPENCRWVDVKTQANNRRPQSEWKPRKQKTWTIDGETKTRKAWCDIYGVGLETALYRINNKGMAIIEALTAPKEAMGRPRKCGCL